MTLLRRTLRVRTLSRGREGAKPMFLLSALSPVGMQMATYLLFIAHREQILLYQPEAWKQWQERIVIRGTLAIVKIGYKNC